MAREKARKGIRWRFWFTVAAWCAVFGSTAFAARQAHRYILADSRFILSPEDRGALKLQGVVNASSMKLIHAFSTDFGRSICSHPARRTPPPIARRRLDRGAPVSRVWPNRLLVRVTERQPVAFASLPVRDTSGAPQRFLLVDAQGVLLDPPARGQFSFPVLNGLTKEQTETGAPRARARHAAPARRSGPVGSKHFRSGRRHS